jgi:hypothetical protein
VLKDDPKSVQALVGTASLLMREGRTAADVSNRRRQPDRMNETRSGGRRGIPPPRDLRLDRRRGAAERAVSAENTWR